MKGGIACPENFYGLQKKKAYDTLRKSSSSDAKVFVKGKCEMNKKVFRQLSYGVYVVTTWDKGRAVGCTANSVMQITSDPATIAVSINHENYTNQCIKGTGRFAVSILGETTDPAIIGIFGFRSSIDTDKFEEAKKLVKGFEPGVKGFLPVVPDACGYLCCEVTDQMETQTHTIFLGKVTEADMLKEDNPMTYAYYHNVVKGTSPKKAPTYIEE